MTTNFHIREVVAGAPDILPVTDEGRQNFVNDLASWWAVLQSHVHINVFLQEARFYDVPSTAGVDMGDPVLIHTFNSPGTSAANLLPPQVALSVTFKTQNRKRWGRSYMGGFTSLASDATGRITQPIMTDLATAYQHLTNRSGTGAALVVYINNVRVVDQYVDVSASTFLRELRGVPRTSDVTARPSTRQPPPGAGRAPRR